MAYSCEDRERDTVIDNTLHVFEKCLGRKVKYSVAGKEADFVIGNDREKSVFLSHHFSTSFLDFRICSILWKAVRSNYQSIPMEFRSVLWKMYSLGNE